MKLFAGVSGNDKIRDPEGKRSRDDCQCLVEPFLTKFFEYSEEFVCITVREDNENIVDGPFGHEAKTSNQADAYGFQFELKPDVVDDIRLVCAGDVQNVICDAYKALLDDKDITTFRKRFTVIQSGTTREERERILADAIKAKSPYKYVEARIYRTLRRKDCVNPEAGENEYIAGLALDGTDESGAGGDMPDDDEDYFK